MKLSTERVLTTHTGSLPRPRSVAAALQQQDRGQREHAGRWTRRTQQQCSSPPPADAPTNGQRDRPHQWLGAGSADSVHPGRW
jgi:hypothetical protein